MLCVVCEYCCPVKVLKWLKKEVKRSPFYLNSILLSDSTGCKLMTTTLKILDLL